MSIYARRVLFILLIVMILAALGAAGFMLGKRAPAPMSEPIAPSQILTQEEQAPAPRRIDTPYQIGQPTMGPLQRTIPIDALALNRDGKRAGAQIFDGVNAGMDVILYDEHGFALPDKGVVARADENGILIDLPRYVAAPMTGDIIAEKTDIARRLPLSALLDGAVWKALPFPDGTARVTRVAVSGDFLRNDSYFHIDDVRADDYIVLNPDGALQEGDILTNVSVVSFDAPLHDAAELSRGRIEQARMAALLYAIETTPVQVMNADGSFTCAAPALTNGE